MQNNTATLDSTSQQIGLNIHKEKAKIMRINTNNKDPIMIGNSPLQDVDVFTLPTLEVFRNIKCRCIHLTYIGSI
jgi:hypothetical protein